MYDFRLRPAQQNDNGRPPSPERDDHVVVAIVAILVTHGHRDGAASDVVARGGTAPETAEAQF